MYGFDKYNDITPEQILQKISQEKIFEWLLKVPFALDQRYLSPYRKDTNAGCWFEFKEDNTLLFMDFGYRPRRHSTCFGMMMELTGYSLSMCIDEICKHFGLSGDSADYKPTTEILYTYEKKDSTPTIITPEYKLYDRRDRIYWNQFIISVEDLEEDNVHSVRKFFLSSKKGNRWIKPYNLCYDIDFIDAHEIYQPYNSKYKWITNCDEDHIGNFDNLPPTGDHLFVEKSYKDHRTLRNLNKEFNVIWFLNEGCIPSMHILTNISFRFQEIIFFYDNDIAGIEAAIKLVNIMNGIRPSSARMIYLPVGPKNISDLVKKEGRSDTLKILNSIL